MKKGMNIMKKIQCMIISFLLIFALTGCDLLNDETKQTIEEFCLENPDDETCVTVEKPMVNDVFIELYEAYQNSPDTFCEQYVDSTGSVHDDCDSVYGTFLTKDLLDYEVTSVNSEILTDTNEYVIVFENSEDNKQATVTVSFSLDGTEIVIDGLSYEVTLLNELTEEELINEIEALITIDLLLFKEDYDFGQSIFTEANTDRLNDWRLVKNNGMNYEIGNYVLNDDGSYTFAIHGALNLVRMFNDELTVYPEFIEGELVLGYGEGYDFYNQIIAMEHLQILLNQIAYQQGTVEDLSVEFNFGENTDIEAINELFQDQNEYSIEGSTVHLDEFTVSFNNVYDNVTLLIRYSYDEVLDTHYLYLEDTVVTKVTTVDFEMLINDFINKFNYRYKTIDEMNLYFTNEMPEELSERYETPYALINWIYGDVTNGTQIVDFRISGHSLIYVIEFILQDDDTYKMSFTLVEDEDMDLRHKIDTDFNHFFDLVDNNVTDTCEQYFDDSSVPYCVDLFSQLGSHNYRYSAAEYKGEYVSISFKYSGITTYYMDYAIDVTFEELEDGTMEYTLVNSHSEREAVNGFLEDFTFAISDSVSIESIYDEFVVSDNEGLTEFIEYIRTNDYSVSIEKTNIELANNYVVYNVYNSNDEFVKSMLMEIEILRVSMGGQNAHKLDVKSLVDVSLIISESEVESYLEDIMEDINSNRYLSSTFCDMVEDFSCTRGNALWAFGLNDVDFSILDIEVLEGTNEYNVSFILVETNHADYEPQVLESTLYFYKENSEIQTKLIHSDLFVLPEIVVFEKEEITEDFVSFLEAIIDESISSLEIIFTNQNHSTYTFIDDRDIFVDFVSVEHTNIIEVTNTSTKDSYTFTDINGDKTVVVYTLIKRDYIYNGAYSIYKDDLIEEPINFTSSELVQYLNGDITLPILLRFYQVGTDVDLVTFLEDNNYTLQLDAGVLNDLECKVLDENGDIVYIIVYRYAITLNMLNQYVVVGRIIDIASEEYNVLEQYIEDLESDLEDGTKTLDDLNVDTDCYSIFPEIYTEASVALIKLESLNNGVGDTYKVIVYYLVDDIAYKTIHEVTVTVVGEVSTFTWTYYGYNAPDPVGPTASLEDATVVITNFMIDYFSPEVTQEYIVDTYFNGMTPELFAEEERNHVLDFRFSYQVVDVTEIFEEGEIIYFSTSVSFEGGIVQDDFVFNVIDLGDNHFYLILMT